MNWYKISIDILDLKKVSPQDESDKVKAGDRIGAHRKIKSNTEPNTIVGPVSSVSPDSCSVINNKGTELEKEFILPFSDWNIQILDI